MNRVIGFAETSTTILIQCPFCSEIHVHSREVDDWGNQGARLSHCHGRSPGYYEIIEVRSFVDAPPRRRSLH